MALRKSVLTPHGFLAIDAYHKVDNLRLVGKAGIAFNVVVCKSADEPLVFSVLSFECEYQLDGANPIAQAYAHLKTLPEFLVAEDC